MKKILFLITLMCAVSLVKAQQNSFIIYNRVFIEEASEKPSILLTDTIGYIKVSKRMVEIDNVHYWKYKKNVFIKLSTGEFVKINFTYNKVNKSFKLLTIYAKNANIYFTRESGKDISSPVFTTKY